MQHLVMRDLKHIWHPCSQMKDYESFPPVVVKKAKGSYIELNDGSKIIDAISSWWCKSLGHGHPDLRAALVKQAKKFEHVISANTCSEVLVELSEKLAGMTQLDKIFYASDGSSAVEIALKMSVHSRLITGETQRHKIMALKNSYHGETALTLAVSDLGLYRAPYKRILIPVTFLGNIPYVNSKDDPLWSNCSKLWPVVENELNKQKDQLTAIIVEPIAQGAGGMLVYSKDFLQRLRVWTRKHNIHLIADEIMTGFYRTGLLLASQHAAITPDFICLGKGLTAGYLPMSAVLTSNNIYNLFYADFAEGKSFLHSHTHTGNMLAAAVALENLRILEKENIYLQVQEMEPVLRTMMLQVAEATKKLGNIRNIGGIVAADLLLDQQQTTERYGYKVFQEAMKYGALLRPLGNTIYWFLPLNTRRSTVLKLRDITIKAIREVFQVTPA
jgi:adenosylmethionine---8-amino-7-oxononanoate aminotransferase